MESSGVLLRKKKPMRLQKNWVLKKDDYMLTTMKSKMYRGSTQWLKSSMTVKIFGVPCLTSRAVVVRRITRRHVACRVVYVSLTQPLKESHDGFLTTRPPVRIAFFEGPLASQFNKRWIRWPNQHKLDKTKLHFEKKVYVEGMKSVHWQVT